jgi:pilus assembly protein FimV
MREYTLLLDPPIYAPGENANSAAPVATPSETVAPRPAKTPAPKAAPLAAETIPAPPRPVTEAKPLPERRRRPARTATASAPAAAAPAAAAATAPAAPELTADGYRVKQGDTLSKIAQSLRPGTRGEVDQTMIALFQSNPRAFDGNINILRQGAILRVPGADELAALNQREAISEVNRQMSAWRKGSEETANAGHLRLVTPKAQPSSGTGTTPAQGAGASNSSNAESLALKDRVKDLESQLAESRRLLDVRNAELSDLQRKLGKSPTAPANSAAPPAAVVAPPAVAPVAAPPATTAGSAPAASPTAIAPTAVAPTPSAPAAGASAAAPADQTAASSADGAAASAASTPLPAPPKVVKKPVAAPPAVAPSDSWLDWLASNWWLPAAVILALLAGLGFAAFKRRQRTQIGEFASMAATTDTDVSVNETTAKILGIRKGDDSFVVEESGEHRAPEFAAANLDDSRSAEDTLSSESAVNLDQGDPLAEADFHMAYGLYDQAADLVRIALDREPDRRDLRLKLLEIYFVWGNKDAFLQTAKTLEATRDRAPAGEWDKIVIMGKQICPDEPLFSKVQGSGRGAGALVDMNLEGGENRIDIDLFGDPEGEHSRDDTAETGESPHLARSASLDFTLDTPERGADESPTREMPPRDEPTVESELMPFGDSPTSESPALSQTAIRQRISDKLANAGADQTAEVSIEDLGLDLDGLDDANATSGKIRALEETDHPDDAPTMVAGLDERSRRMMAEAESRSRDKDLTELERELEASFISELESSQEEIRTAVIGPESAPTVHMPIDLGAGATSRFGASKPGENLPSDRDDLDSTSKLRGINADSIDLDLDRLATALGSGDTLEQPRAADEIFSTEVFDASQRSRRVDLDVGEALNGSDALTPTVRGQNGTAKLGELEDSLPEFEPVTMSEVGTKLDLARAYMDMGDPEGARNILDEVVLEGSASQKQEAQRLIQALPG